MIGILWRTVGSWLRLAFSDHSHREQNRTDELTKHETTQRIKRFDSLFVELNLFLFGFES